MPGKTEEFRIQVLSSSYVRELDSLLTQTRDTLFDWSRNYLHSDDTSERAKIDGIFALAKRADVLRREINEIATRKSTLQQYRSSKTETVNDDKSVHDPKKIIIPSQ